MDPSKVLEWMEGVPQMGSLNDLCWLPQLRHVQDAIKYSNESSPGPDGIPYLAFKSFKYAADVLYGVLRYFLENEDARPPPGFNEAFLCCLPKKPVKVDEELGDLFDAEHTRPLSIVNTDNRILAAALRLVLEPIAGSWVSGAQRGFLSGRSMLANLLEVD